MKIKRIYSGNKIRFVFIVISLFLLLCFFLITFNSSYGYGEYYILPIVIVLMITPFTYCIDIFDDYLVYHYYFFVGKKIYIKDVKKIDYVFGVKASEPTYSLKVTLKNKQYIKINAKAFNTEDLNFVEKFLLSR